MGLSTFHSGFSVAVPALITVVFAYLYRLKGREYFLWWTWGWAFESARALAEAMYEHAPTSQWGEAVAYPLMTTGLVFSALLFLVGVRQLLDRRIEWGRLYVLVGIVAVWSLISPGIVGQWLWAVAPGFLLGSVAMCWMGGSFFANASRRPVYGGRILGVLLLIWGVHLLLYPFGRYWLTVVPGMSELVSVRFSLSALISVGVGIFMIVYVSEETALTLRRTEERFSRLFSEASECILVADPDTRSILYANRRTQDLSGYSPEELRGLPVGRVLLDSDAEPPEGTVATSPVRWMPDDACPKSAIVDQWLRHRDGRRVPVSITRSLIERDDKRRVVLIQMRDETESKHSRDELRIQFERLRALHQISTALSRALDVNRIYQIVFERVCLVFPLDFFVVDLYDSEENTLRRAFKAERIENEFRRSTPGGKHPPSRMSFETLIRDRQPILENRGMSPMGEVAAVEIVDTPSSSVPGSRMFVPMVASDEVLGILSVQTRQPAAYDSSMLDLFQNLANLTATALGQSNLFFREHEHSERMRFLKDLGNALASPVDLRANLKTAQSLVAEFLHADRAVIHLHDSDTERLLPSSALPQGPPTPFDPPEGYPNGSLSPVTTPAHPSTPPTPPEMQVPDISTVCFMTGQPVVENDLSRESGDRVPDSVRGHQVLSSVAVPISLRGRPIGVIRVDDCRTPSRFERSDMDFLLLVAKQLTSAVENARIFEQVRRAKTRFFEMVEASPFGVAVLRAMRLVYANRTLRENLGRAEEKFTDRPLADLVDPGDLRTLELHLRRLSEGQTLSPFEISLIHRDGRRRFCEVHLAHVSEGGERAVQAVFVDATQAAGLMRGSSSDYHVRALESLLVGLASDFGFTLSAILGQAAYLRLIASPDERIARSMETIELTALRASEYLKQILALRDRESSGLALEDLGVFLRERLDEFATLHPSRPRFEVEVAEGLPHVQFPENLFRLALAGLLNALLEVFPSEGDITVRVRPRAWDSALGKQIRELPRGDYIETRFAPRSGNIAPKDLNRLTHPEEHGGRDPALFGVPLAIGLFRAMGGAVVQSRTSDGKPAIAIWLSVLPEAEKRFPTPHGVSSPGALSLEATPLPVYDSPEEMVVLPDDEDPGKPS